MRGNVKLRIAWSVVMILPATACGSDGGPEDALNSFAEAINARDDAAVQRLTCASARDDGGPTLADPLANSPMNIDEIDPRLRDIRYVAEAGDISDETDTKATGELTITVEGIPDDLSPDAQNVLDSSLAPFPLGLIGGDDKVTLVKEGDAWVVCDEE
jgi:hypothetical protein